MVVTVLRISETSISPEKISRHPSSICCTVSLTARCTDTEYKATRYNAYYLMCDIGL